ncbi:MAG: hypothetical protein H6711_31515 [Myxococcales bacterium]|nr:hypothetical protein [Myxococcales bacterium]
MITILDGDDALWSRDDEGAWTRTPYADARPQRAEVSAPRTRLHVERSGAPWLLREFFHGDERSAGNLPQRTSYVYSPGRSPGRTHVERGASLGALSWPKEHGSRGLRSTGGVCTFGQADRASVGLPQRSENSMDLIQPPAEAAPHGLSLLKAVAQANEAGAMSEASRRFLEGAQRVVLGTDLDLDALPESAPERLAAALPEDPALRRQFLQGMVVVSLADGIPTPGQNAIIQRSAKALGVEPPEVHSLRYLSERRIAIFRLDFMRSSHMRKGVEHSYADQSLMGFVKSVLSTAGLIEDPGVAAMYRDLERLPEDTLGHQLYQHFRHNNFAFPGEKHGFPESGVYHDVTHVLSGYDTTPQGEMQIAAFIDGYMKQGPFSVAIFTMVMYSAGVNLSPLVDQPYVPNILAEPGLVEKILHAWRRGAQVNTDLSDQWNFWPYLPRPVDEVRRELGVPA